MAPHHSVEKQASQPMAHTPFICFVWGALLLAVAECQPPPPPVPRPMPLITASESAAISREWILLATLGARYYDKHENLWNDVAETCIDCVKVACDNNPSYSPDCPNYQPPTVPPTEAPAAKVKGKRKSKRKGKKGKKNKNEKPKLTVEEVHRILGKPPRQKHNRNLKDILRKSLGKQIDQDRKKQSKGKDANEKFSLETKGMLVIFKDKMKTNLKKRKGKRREEIAAKIRAQKRVKVNRNILDIINGKLRQPRLENTGVKPLSPEQREIVEKRIQKLGDVNKNILDVIEGGNFKLMPRQEKQYGDDAKAKEEEAKKRRVELENVNKNILKIIQGDQFGKSVLRSTKVEKTNRK